MVSGDAISRIILFATYTIRCISFHTASATLIRSLVSERCFHPHPYSLHTLFHLIPLYHYFVKFYQPHRVCSTHKGPENPYIIFIGKPGRPKVVYEDNIKMNPKLRGWKDVDWIYRA
jgi:hypothetical protein